MTCHDEIEIPSAGASAIGTRLQCTCGGSNLHRKGVVDLDDESDDLVIEFYCEHCGEDKPVFLRITDHKGSVYLAWVAKVFTWEVL